MAGTVHEWLRFAGSTVRVLWWVTETIWLGAAGMAGAIRFVARVPKGFATTLPCPRGHRVELYGTFRCRRCRAAREGRVFDPCGICGARPTHLDCERCGLPVRDPLP